MNYPMCPDCKGVGHHWHNKRQTKKIICTRCFGEGTTLTVDKVSEIQQELSKKRRRK